MHCKTDAILKRLKVAGKVVIKMEAESGLRQVTLTMRGNDSVLIGTHPGARITQGDIADVARLIEDNRFFINGWF